MSRARVSGEQRVFSLVLALVASPYGATKRELLSTVHGYADRFRSGTTSVALERQFERDKEQLRALGIPLETIDSPLEPGNTQLTRYRIVKERLQIPSDLRFSERELMLLRLAAFAWSEGSLTAQARRAAIKLEALGAGLDVQQLGVAPRIWAPDPSLSALQRAIEEGREVRFRYRLPDRTNALRRHVAPLRLHRADGRWHLIAWDLERDAPRVFLLTRITGEIAVESSEYDASLRARADDIVDSLLAREREQVATLLVRRGTVAESRLTPRAVSSEEDHHSEEWRRLRVGTLDYVEHALATELAAYGSDVHVVEPELLQKAVVQILRDTLDAHTRTKEGTARVETA